MSDIVNKLWGFCHTLRHDGVDYGDYIEQLTFLLFIKMADERGVAIPAGCEWATLKGYSGTSLTDHYSEIVRKLREAEGLLGDIFAQAMPRFNNPVNLKRLITMIDDEDWSSMDVDVKGAAFEGLLERAASEGKKGAGQYFTPRILIQSIVRVMKPDPRNVSDFKLADPAVGTGGFLMAAYEWLLGETKGALERKVIKRIREQTYFGQELVARPRRLALMNLFLHGLQPQIHLGDTIYEPDRGERYDIVLTNPPFGTKGANQAPEREDFTVETRNKQLNFVQHVLTILKPGGRAAVVLPDNCLFEDKAGEVFEILMQDCNVHTILRLPRGTFTPYSQGIKANVVFFQKGLPTENVWIYDGRANVPGVTKKSRPLTSAHFGEFEVCYGLDPNGRTKRTDQGETGRFRKFHISDVKQRGYKLDITWLKDDSLEDSDDLLEPVLLATETIAELEAAVDGMKHVATTLETPQDNTFEHVAGRLADAEARLNTVPGILKRFRMSVLAAACSGRLTDDWRGEAGNDELPTGWQIVTVGDVLPAAGGIFDGPFGSSLKSSDYAEAGVRVIRLENVGHLRFLENKRTYISPEKYESLKRHSVYAGDLIFASFISEEVRTCLLPDLCTLAIAKADCFCLRPKPELMLVPYLAYQLACHDSLRSLQERVHGATRPRINIPQLKAHTIRWCPIEEQTEIVRRVESLFRHPGLSTVVTEKRLRTQAEAPFARQGPGEQVEQRKEGRTA